MRRIRVGVERLPAGYNLPRHRHLEAYATVLLEGSFIQTSYSGRMVVEQGDVLVQPTLDCHADRMISPGIVVLRLPWSRTDSFGGVYRGIDVEFLQKAAQRDPAEASWFLRRELNDRAAPGHYETDWEDQLAAQLRVQRISITRYAEVVGVSRESISRGFRRVYGVSPAQFRSEIHAREAWLQITAGEDRLCDIAHRAGFADQPHMTRAVRALTGATPGEWRMRHGDRYPVTCETGHPIDT